MVEQWKKVRRTGNATILEITTALSPLWYGGTAGIRS